MLCSFSSVATKAIETHDKGNWKSVQKKAGSFQIELATGSRNFPLVAALSSGTSSLPLSS